MGLVPFQGRQVGFWVVPRGFAAREEVPEGVPVTEVGEPLQGGRALIVAAADEAGVPLWAVVVHSPGGAALLVEWQDQLFCGLGTRAVMIDRDGQVHGEVRTGEELSTAWKVGEELLVLSQGRGTLLQRDLKARWSRPLEGESFHLLAADNGQIRLAAMGADDWREVVLDALTGVERT